MDHECQRLRVPTVFELLTLYSVKTQLLGGIGVACRALIQSKGDGFRKYCEVVKIDAIKDLQRCAPRYFLAAAVWAPKLVGGGGLTVVW